MPEKIFHSKLTNCVWEKLPPFPGPIIIMRSSSGNSTSSRYKADRIICQSNMQRYGIRNMKANVSNLYIWNTTTKCWLFSSSGSQLCNSMYIENRDKRMSSGSGKDFAYTIEKIENFPVKWVTGQLGATESEDSMEEKHTYGSKLARGKWAWTGTGETAGEI